MCPWDKPTSLSFLSLFFLKKARKTTKKTRIFYPYRTLKSLEKKGKTLKKNKEILAGEKNKEFQKNKERKDRVCPGDIPGLSRGHSRGVPRATGPKSLCLCAFFLPDCCRQQEGLFCSFTRMLPKGLLMVVSKR